MSATFAQLDDGDGVRCTVGRLEGMPHFDAAMAWRRLLAGAVTKAKSR